MESEMNVLQKISYESRRWPMAIDVKLDGDEIQWSSRYLGNEWHERLPISTLVPFPTISIERSTLKFGIGTFVAVLVAPFIIIPKFGMTLLAGALIALACFLGMALTAAVWRRGPLKWASFKSFYPEKSVCFFQNSGDPHFDQFVDSLREAIVKSREDAIKKRSSA
jgi:hypothetical protein